MAGLDLVEFGASFRCRAVSRGTRTRFCASSGKRSGAVIVVGGTGLYFRALTRGLCEAPQGSEELARRAGFVFDRETELQARLMAVDPAMLERIDAANPRRLAARN